MLHAAKRLHEAGFANNRKLLYDDAMYDFSDEARQLASEATELLTSAKDSTFYAEGFKKLRQAFFLDSDNISIRTALADIYQKCGHVAVAELYRAPLKILDLRSKNSRANAVSHKVLERKYRAYRVHTDRELGNFTKWLEAKGYDVEKIDNIKKEMGTTLRKRKGLHSPDLRLLDKIFYNKNAIEMLDSDQALDILIHNSDHDGASDNTMRLLLEYTGETAPAVLDRPRVVTVINNRASALKKLANSLGKNGQMLKRILRLAF